MPMSMQRSVSAMSRNVSGMIDEDEDEEANDEDHIEGAFAMVHVNVKSRSLTPALSLTSSTPGHMDMDDPFESLKQARSRRGKDKRARKGGGDDADMLLMDTPLNMQLLRRVDPGTSRDGISRLIAQLVIANCKRMEAGSTLGDEPLASPTPVSKKTSTPAKAVHRAQTWMVDALDSNDESVSPDLRRHKRALQRIMQHNGVYGRMAAKGLEPTADAEVPTLFALPPAWRHLYE